MTEYQAARVNAEVTIECYAFPEQPAYAPVQKKLTFTLDETFQNDAEFHKAVDAFAQVLKDSVNR